MKSFILRFLLCYFLALGQAFAQTASILPQGITQFLDNNGNPLSSGKVFFYVPSTTTFKTTWQDAAKAVANTNPVILDSAGRAKIYGDGTYRQQVKASNNNLIYDAVTSSASTSGGGASGIGDGDAVGTVKPYAGLVSPTNYAFAYGQELSRTTYLDLYNAITFTQTITCASGNPTATGFSDTSQIPAGAVIETTCFAPGTIVVSKSTTTVTFNNNSSLSTSASARIFLYGNGNGTTTFNVPDMRGYTIAGRCNMGGVNCSNLTFTYFNVDPQATGAKGGSQSKTLQTINFPPYTPLGTVSYTPVGTIVTTTGITDNRTWSIATNYFGTYNGTNADMTPTAGTASSLRAGTVTPSGTITASSSSAFTGTPGTPIFTGTAQGGTSTPISVVQPTQTLNYIIKIIADSAGIATGMTSLIGDCTATGVGEVTITCTKTNNVAFGTMATQNASGVAITNGSGNFSSLSINGVPVGTSTDTFWSALGGGNIGYAGGSVAVSNIANCPEVKTNATGVLSCNVFTPEQYGGGCGNVVADSTAAFVSMINAIVSAGRGRVELNKDCIVGATAYILYPTLVAPSVNGLPTLTGLSELIFNCNGATLDVPYNFSGHTNTVVYMFSLANSKNITFNNCQFDQSSYRNKGDATNGVSAVNVSEGVVGLNINNHFQRGGKAALLCQRGPTLSRSWNVKAQVTTEDVYYPFALARTCDNAQGLIHATRPGRAFFVYNVNTVNGQVWSDNADGPQDVIVSNNYDSTDTGGNEFVNTSNIKLQYTNFSQGATGAGLNAFMTIVFQTTGAEGSATIENVDATLNIIAAGSQGTGSILTILNQTATPQSRLLKNISVKGTSSMITPSGNIMELMTDKNWAGDFVLNLQIGPFYIAQGSGQFKIDGRAIAGPVSLNSVWAAGSGGGISYVPTNMNGLGGYVIYDRVYLPTLIPSPTP